MEAGSVEAIVRALNARNVRYLIAGGLAVVAHGHVRFTADMDLILDLDPGNLRQALTALAELHYGPRAPVRLDEFANPEQRARWIREEGLPVFSLYTPRHPATEIDVFVELPLDFERAHGSAERMVVPPLTPRNATASNAGSRPGPSLSQVAEKHRNLNKPQCEMPNAQRSTRVFPPKFSVGHRALGLRH